MEDGAADPKRGAAAGGSFRRSPQGSAPARLRGNSACQAAAKSPFGLAPRPRAAFPRDLSRDTAAERRDRPEARPSHTHLSALLANSATGPTSSSPRRGGPSRTAAGGSPLRAPSHSRARVA